MKAFMFTEDCIFSEIEESGNILCHMHIPGTQGEEATDAIYGVVKSWDECGVHYSNEDTILEIYFRIDSALNSVIDDYMSPCTGKISVEAKPMLDAMRKKLIEMIGLIDSLQFDET